MRCISNVEQADGWGAVPGDFVGEGAVWYDGADFWVVDIGIDDAAAKDRRNLHSVGGVAMDVAGVSDGGATDNIARCEEAGHGSVEDFALTNGLASDFRKNGVGYGLAFLNGHRSIRVVGRGGGDNGGVLATSGRIARDVDGVVNLGGFVGGEGPSQRGIDGDPFDDLVVAHAIFGEDGLVVVVNIEWLYCDSIRDVFVI